jgi:hypothetical protein
MKSKVNQAAVYTKPTMRKALFEKIKGQAVQGTGERYLPSAAIKSLTAAEYAATTRAKRAGMAKGKQFVAQPKKIAAKTKGYR